MLPILLANKIAIVLICNNGKSALFLNGWENIHEHIDYNIKR